MYRKTSSLFFPLLILPFLLIQQVRAQNAVRIQVKTDAAKITVGDQVRYFIEATADTTQTRLQWASFPDTFNTLEIVEKGKIDTTRSGSMVTYKQRLLITGFDSGLFRIPAFVLLGRNKDGSTDTLRTDTLQLLVQTVAVDTTQAFKSIKGIVAVKVSWKDYIWYIAGGLLLLLAIIGITVYLVRNRKPKAKPTEPEVMETDQERALRLLDELVEKHLWEQNKVKEYYTELTDIVRSYIEARFQTPALELTTDELLKKAKKNREMIPFVPALSSLLHTADLAKFAKASPSPEEHISAIDMAKHFVSISKPRIEVPQQPKQPNT